MIKVGKRLIEAERRTLKLRKTLLNSKIMKQTPCVDMDKKVFLGEVLKLLAYADSDFKQQEYVGFYNAGLAIAFMCVQTKQFVLAGKVYSMFG